MKNKPPVSSAKYQFKFPEYTFKKLNKGLKFYHVAGNDSPLFSLKIISNSGAYDELIPGLTYMTSQMTTKGTKKRSQGKIALELENMGINFNSGTGWDSSFWNLVCLDDYRNKALDILKDCIFNSIFPEKENKILKNRILADNQQKQADPAYLAKQAFYSVIFENSPYGKPLTGTEESLKIISKKFLTLRYEELIEENDFTIISSGPFKQNEIIDMLKSSFGLIKNKTDRIKSTRKKNLLNNNLISIAVKESADQTALRIGKFTIGIKHPDYIPLTLANTVFGGYFMSRLNSLIREKLGYTYGIHSFIDYRLNGSTFQISSSVNKTSTGKTISAVFRLMEKFASSKINKEEFNRAKQYSLGTFLRNTESNQQIMSLLGNIDLFDLNHNYYSQAYEKIQSLTIDEVFEVQQKYFLPEKMVIAVSGDRDYLSKELKSFGEIRFYET